MFGIYSISGKPVHHREEFVKEPYYILQDGDTGQLKLYGFNAAFHETDHASSYLVHLTRYDYCAICGTSWTNRSAHQNEIRCVNVTKTIKMSVNTYHDVAKPKSVAKRRAFLRIALNEFIEMMYGSTKQLKMSRRENFSSLPRLFGVNGFKPRHLPQKPGNIQKEEKVKAMPFLDSRK